MQGTLKIKEVKESPGPVGGFFLRGTVEGTLKPGMACRVGDHLLLISDLYLYKGTFFFSKRKQLVTEESLKPGEYVDVHLMAKDLDWSGGIFNWFLRKNVCPLFLA